MFRTTIYSMWLIAAFAACPGIGLAVEGVVYKAGKVYTLSGDPISPGQVLVLDGKIKAVGSEVEPGNAEVIDLGKGSVLIPGLVNAYSQTPLGNGGVNEVTEEITLGFRAIDSVDWTKPELLRQTKSGTTTICVCPGTENVFSGTAAIVKTVSGASAVLSASGPLVASMCSDPARRNGARSRP
jgi:imidazolonepropionase-like amidohydrolase